MPIYEYKCEEGHTFEVLQSIWEPETLQCKYCEGSAHRVLSPVNFVLKGPGFYVNDYKKKGPSAQDSPHQEGTKPEKREKDPKGKEKDSRMNLSNGT